MKDFILLFRQAGNEQPLLNDEEIAKINKKWQDWIGDIEAQGKLSDHGSRLEKAGKVLIYGIYPSGRIYRGYTTIYSFA